MDDENDKFLEDIGATIRGGPNDGAPDHQWNVDDLATPNNTTGEAAEWANSKGQHSFSPHLDDWNHQEDGSYIGRCGDPNCGETLRYTPGRKPNQHGFGGTRDKISGSAMHEPCYEYASRLLANHQRNTGRSTEGILKRPPEFEEATKVNDHDMGPYNKAGVSSCSNCGAEMTKETRSGKVTGSAIDNSCNAPSTPEPEVPQQKWHLAAAKRSEANGHRMSPVDSQGMSHCLRCGMMNDGMSGAQSATESRSCRYWRAERKPKFGQDVQKSVNSLDGPQFTPHPDFGTRFTGTPSLIMPGFNPETAESDPDLLPAESPPEGHRPIYHVTGNWVTGMGEGDHLHLEARRPAWGNKKGVYWATAPYQGYIGGESPIDPNSDHKEGDRDLEHRYTSYHNEHLPFNVLRLHEHPDDTTQGFRRNTSGHEERTFNDDMHLVVTGHHQKTVPFLSGTRPGQSTNTQQRTLHVYDVRHALPWEREAHANQPQQFRPKRTLGPYKPPGRIFKAVDDELLTKAPKVRPTADILNSHIKKGDGDHWVWTGAKTTNTPVIGYKGKTKPAAMVAYNEFGDGVPEGKKLRRTCSEPLCVNPAHHEVNDAGNRRGHKPQESLARLMSHVNEKPGGHWHWEDSVQGHDPNTIYGDGTLRASNALYRAHRGEIPDNHRLRRLCTDPKCLNPFHREATLFSKFKEPQPKAPRKKPGPTAVHEGRTLDERMNNATVKYGDHLLWQGSLFGNAPGLSVYGEKGQMTVNARTHFMGKHLGQNLHGKNIRIRPTCGEPMCVNPEHCKIISDMSKPHRGGPVKDSLKSAVSDFLAKIGGGVGGPDDPDIDLQVMGNKDVPEHLHHEYIKLPGEDYPVCRHCLYTSFHFNPPEEQEHFRFGGHANDEDWPCIKDQALGHAIIEHAADAHTRGHSIEGIGEKPDGIHAGKTWAECGRCSQEITATRGEGGNINVSTMPDWNDKCPSWYADNPQLHPMQYIADYNKKHGLAPRASAEPRQVKAVGTREGMHEYGAQHGHSFHPTASPEIDACSNPGCKAALRISESGKAVANAHVHTACQGVQKASEPEWWEEGYKEPGTGAEPQAGNKGPVEHHGPSLTSAIQMFYNNGHTGPEIDQERDDPGAIKYAHTCTTPGCGSHYFVHRAMSSDDGSSKQLINGPALTERCGEPQPFAPYMHVYPIGNKMTANQARPYADRQASLTGHTLSPNWTRDPSDGYDKTMCENCGAEAHIRPHNKGGDPAWLTGPVVKDGEGEQLEHRCKSIQNPSYKSGEPEWWEDGYKEPEKPTKPQKEHLDEIEHHGPSITDAAKMFHANGHTGPHIDTYGVKDGSQSFTNTCTTPGCGSHYFLHMFAADENGPSSRHVNGPALTEPCGAPQPYAPEMHVYPIARKMTTDESRPYVERQATLLGHSLSPNWVHNDRTPYTDEPYDHTTCQNCGIEVGAIHHSEEEDTPAGTLSFPHDSGRGEELEHQCEAAAKPKYKAAVRSTMSTRYETDEQLVDGYTPADYIAKMLLPEATKVIDKDLPQAKLLNDEGEVANGRHGHAFHHSKTYSFGPKKHVIKCGRRGCNSMIFCSTGSDGSCRISSTNHNSACKGAGASPGSAAQ